MHTESWVVSEGYTVTSCEPAAFWEEAAVTDCRLNEKQTLRLVINGCWWRNIKSKWYCGRSRKVAGIIGVLLEKNKWSCRIICGSICFLVLGCRVMRRSEKLDRNDPTKGRTEEMWGSGEINIIQPSHVKTQSAGPQWLRFIWPCGSDGKMSLRRCGLTQRIEVACKDLPLCVGL